MTLLTDGQLSHFTAADSLVQTSPCLPRRVVESQQHSLPAKHGGVPGGSGRGLRNDKRGQKGKHDEVEAGQDRSPRSVPISKRDAPKQASQIMATSNTKKITVGYALTSKKTKSFIQPKLEVIARNKGIVFVAIDRNRPLEEQGPFDVILHKITGKDWRQQLEEFKRRHPDVIVLDPPDAIQHVRNRQSMLQKVAELNLKDCGALGQVGIPRQLVVTGDPATIPDVVAKAGLRLPLVAKPLVVDGTAKSHALSLAFDEFCLTELDPPLVLQEFVNHGGLLFKVYIVGDSVKVVRRFSLPDVHEPVGNGVIPFPRVSNAAASADDADLDPQVYELPPRKLLESLARELRRKLGLRLFNLDIIREGGTGNHYYVIDINYFPGYGKMPDYEYIFTDFLLSLAQREEEKVNAGIQGSKIQLQEGFKDK